MIKTKLYDKRDDFTFQLSSSHLSVAIFQQHQRMDFTFHKAYIIL
jgi:hypothetical protein